MANERQTEAIVRRHFEQDPVITKTPGRTLLIEEQQSADFIIQKSLATASKKGAGVGRPEFIIRDPNAPQFLIVVECKAQVAKHESNDRDRPAEYAVDGVLHYARHLSGSYDVVAIAVSGTSERSLCVSSFMWRRGDSQYNDLRDSAGTVSSLRDFDTLRNLLAFDSEVRARTLADLMAFSRELHDYMRDYAKVSELEKPLLVGGILMALRDNAFRNSWRSYTDKDLARQVYEAIKRETENSDMSSSKRRAMLQPFSFIPTHPELGRPSGNRDSAETPLRRLIYDLDYQVRPFTEIYQDFDVVGHFYREFLRYTGGDKKSLGIVLTPKHITDLFVRIANVSPHDTVLDNCCGTGGFLIAAMASMYKKAGANPKLRDRISRHGLVGVEQQPTMFALASASMIMFGDGKSNIYQGNCFDSTLVQHLTETSHQRHKRANVGLINPPFSQRGEGLHELDFVIQLLDCLEPGGTAVVVVPASIATTMRSPKRAELLSRHTLVAAMSLPDEIFHPVAVITCALVLKAGVPHSLSPAPTWFGYWKDDGFVKTKDRGRHDMYNRWPEIRESWISSFHRRANTPGHSVNRFVTAADEWCAEAYLETDENSITGEEFARSIRDFAVFQVTQRLAENEVPQDAESELRSAQWKEFQINSLFDVVRGRRVLARDLQPGSTPYVRAIAGSNGVTAYADLPAEHPGGTITVAVNGNNVAEAYYQPDPYFASDDVAVLVPKFEMSREVGLFVATAIRGEKFRFSYGRKWFSNRMSESTIKLPADGEGGPDWGLCTRYVASLPMADVVSADETAG